MTGVGWLLSGIALWTAGTVVFDVVHWLLHRMLGSRWRPLRALAWPHAVHHEWLGRDLRLHPEFQRKNVFCHLVPEFLTQLAFSGVLWSLLPPGPVLVCVALQVAAFAYLLSQKGSDVNHRPIEMLDAHRPSLFCPPTYHALHHVHPDAYFSAYTKLVDWVVLGGAEVARRRFALWNGETVFGRALRAELESAGVREIEALAPGAASGTAPPDVDVLVLCAPDAREVERLEAFVDATRERQLPPEVWAVHERADDPTARHYVSDVRVIYRTLVVDAAALRDAGAARRAARLALRRVRRGLHVVPTSPGAAAWRSFRRFRRIPPERPPGVPRVRSRAELAAAAG